MRRVLAVLLALLGLPAPGEGRPARRPVSRPRPAAPIAAALLWPLPFDAGLTASFGELRGDRLHTGIDLSTRGETGHPVRAVAAGQVVRLREEWRGYGLALYLRIAGGRIAVYGHLARVAPDLERRLARARRERASRWAGDVMLDPGRPARRGEVLAWSGESGAGLPHLHFELRDGMERPLDPFAAGLQRPAGATAPLAERLVIEPAAPEARIDGAAEALVLPLTLEDGVWRPPRAPLVAGPVRLLVEAFDRAPGGAKMGLAGLVTRLDGREVFRLGFDAVPFAAHHTSGAVLDLARSHLAPTFYTWRLTGLEGAELPFASPGVGAVRLAPGRHEVEADLAGSAGEAAGAARVRFALEAEAAPPASPAPPAEGSVEIEARPGRTTSLALGGARLVVGEEAAWAPVRIAAREVPAPLPEGLRAISPAVGFSPDGHPFCRPVEIAFAATADPRSGVYRFDPVTSAWLLEDMGASARARRLATYALLADESPPVLEALEVTGRELSVRATDVGSGIPERGVEVWVDGRKLEELYDPDRGRVTARWDGPAGERAVRIRAADRALNYNQLEERRRFR